MNSVETIKNSNIAHDSFRELFPNKKIPNISLKYSGHLKEYNGNIRKSPLNLEIKLGKKWEFVSEEIKKGIIQVLLLKIYREEGLTLNIELYNKFIEKVGKYSERINSDPLLVQYFEELNNEYFNSMIEMPNLIFGNNNFSKLGSYQFENDTVIITSALKNEEELCKYVLYHELLHKKHGIRRGKRNFYHTKKFRIDEKKWKDPEAEKKLTRFLRRKKIRRLFALN